MTKRFFFGLVSGAIMLICFSATPLHAQKDSNTTVVYLELFGSSDIYSLNVEYLIKGKHSIQAGLAWVPGTWQVSADNDRSFYYFPLGYHYLVGKERHKLDVFCGIIYTLTNYNTSPNNNKFKPQMGLMYRYQRKKGLFFRSGFTLKLPANLSADRDEVFFYAEQHWLFWPAVAMGYSF